MPNDKSALPGPPGQVADATPADRQSEPFHLFIYGTLTSPTVFRAVLGKDLTRERSKADGVRTIWARRAVLPGYTKISPDNTYLYAVPDFHGRIRGYLVGPIDGACMDALVSYEGRNYKRVPVNVRTARRSVKAYAFVADTEQFSHAFGYEFRDHLKQEILLREKIDKVLDNMQDDKDRRDADLSRRALAELHGQTIRDLVRQHFESHGISDFYIRQVLADERLRDYHALLSQDGAEQLCYPYLSLVVRQVLFNEIEDRIWREFRYDLDRINTADRIYERTISSLATLRMLNERQDLLELLAGDAVTDLGINRNHHLIDYVRWSVATADSLYDASEAQRHMRYIRTHMGRGHIPLGAELEFSNVGHWVIAEPFAGAVEADPVYHGFRYFSHFALDILMWKLGGHVDDHMEKLSDKPKKGFLEFAMGTLSIAENLSKPVCTDPWILNQMIQQTMRFYPVHPHSLHLSLQLSEDHRPGADDALPLSVMKCLFAILGDPRRCVDGKVRLTRLIGPEIVSHRQCPQMLFSSVSRRRSQGSSDQEYLPAAESKGTLVQQFKFMRLSPRINYEPVAMALKGLQLHYQPGSFLTPTQARGNPRLLNLFEQLAEWGDNPQPIAERDVREFLRAIHQGLLIEQNGQPAHGEAYIGFCLDSLAGEIKRFNRMLREHATG